MVRIVLLCLCFLQAVLACGQQVLGSKKRYVYDIAVHGSTLGLISDNSVELWNANDRSLIRSVPHSCHDCLTTVCFGADSNTIITGSKSGEIAAWDMLTGEKTLLQSSPNPDAVTSIDFNMNRKLLAVGYSGNKVLIYDLSSVAKVIGTVDHNYEITSVKFTSDNLYLISADAGGAAILHHINENKSTRIYTAPGRISDLTLSADGKQLAIARANGHIMVIKGWLDQWEKPYERIEIIKGNSVASVDFHMKENKTLASATEAGRVEINMEYGIYRYRTHATINRVKFVSAKLDKLVMAVATMGKGIIILSATKMKYRQIRPIRVDKSKILAPPKSF